MQRTGVVLFGLAGFFLVFSPRAEGALIGYWPLDATSGNIATNRVPAGPTAC